MELEKLIIGGAVAVIGFFLRGLYADMKAMKEDVNTNKQDISLLKQEARTNREYFNEKFEMLLNEIREIHTDIKSLKK